MSSQATFNLVIGVVIAGLMICRQVFGAARAATARIWMQDGQSWVQGGVVTAARCVLAPAAHLGRDYAVGLGKGTSGPGSATIVLYLAVTLGVQRLIVQLAAQRLGPATLRRFGSWSGLTSKPCVLGERSRRRPADGLSAVGPVPVHVKFFRRRQSRPEIFGVLAGDAGRALKVTIRSGRPYGRTPVPGSGSAWACGRQRPWSRG